VTPPRLRLAGVEAGYGDLLAVRDVSLEVRPGEIVALIGSNGAGKTTTLRAICGLVPLRGGEVELDGVSIAGHKPSAIVAGGIAHVPEGRQLFPGMTVRENLELGARTPESRRHRAETLERVIALFPRLGERGQQLAGTLSGGEQQMVAIGRALMARPRLLLLDEPSLGLAPAIIERLFTVLAELREEGVTLLLVDQMAGMALALADRAYIIETGRIIAAGDASAIAEDPALREAYLG